MSIMKAVEELIQEVADEQIEPHSIVLRAKITAIETLLDMLWTNELSKAEDPVGEAQELKETVLGLIEYNEDDVYEQLSFKYIEERLDSIIHRVSHQHGS